jgi:hypothetical protein
MQVTVAEVNGAPVARDDFFTAKKNMTLTVAAPGILGNDTDPDGDPFTFEVLSTAAHGTLTVNLDGSLSYTPNTGYTGPDSFTYRLFDGLAYSSTATVQFDVAPGSNLSGTPVVVEAVEGKLCLAVHDVSTGGLAVSAAEMALGGDVGCILDLPSDRGAELRAQAGVGLASDGWLFSEAPTRWLVEARNGPALEKHFATAAVPVARVGKVGGKAIHARKGRRVLVDLPLSEARKAFDGALKGVVG